MAVLASCSNSDGPADPSAGASSSSVVSSSSVLSSTTTTPVVPPTTISPTTAVPPTTAVATVGDLVFKHCRVTTSGCVVDDPGARDTTARELPVPAPRHAALRYGPAPEHLLDVHLPAGRVDGVIVYFHSGGWTAGGRANIPTTIVHELDLHRAVISVDYRLAPSTPWPAQAYDADRAIRWIKVHAADWGLAGRPFVVAGGSAGGHLALFTGAAPGHLVDPTLPTDLRAVDPRVDGVVALAAPADIGSMLAGEWGPAMVHALLGCAFDCSPSELVDASPSTHLTAAAPPVYLAVGALDTLVPPKENLVALAAAWTAATTARRVWVDLIDDQGHNIDVAGINVTALDEFLALVTAP